MKARSSLQIVFLKSSPFILPEPRSSQEGHTEMEAYGPKAGSAWERSSTSLSALVDASKTLITLCRCCRGKAKVAENLNSKKPEAQVVAGAFRLAPPLSTRILLLDRFCSVTVSTRRCFID